MNRRSKLVVAGVLGCAPLMMLGNGMRLASQDGFATARGEAFVATADNASAIYYNPAGITQLDGSQVRAGLYRLYFDPTFKPPASSARAGQTFGLEERLAGVPQLFLTHTFESQPLSVGLGVYAPFGSGASWPDDTGFRAVATEGALTYITLNPVMAVKAGPNLSFAAGLMVNYGDITLEQGLRRFATPLTNFFRFTGDGWSVGYNLGVLLRAHEKVSLGFSFRSAAEIRMEGRTTFELEPVIRKTRREAVADFEFPMTAAVGISYRPTPKWNLEFDADWTDWSSFGTVMIRQAPPPFPVQQNVPVTLEWRASWLYAFGVTRYFDNGWHVSAGYVFNQNSVPDDYYSPLAADMDRHFVSVGAGRKGTRFDFDVAYQFGYGPAHTVTGSTPSSSPAQFAGQNADGTYDFVSHGVLMTVGMRF